jgi:hypothetical protein
MTCMARPLDSGILSLRRSPITGKSRLRQGRVTRRHAGRMTCSQRQGLVTMDEFKFAIFEASGAISIIPWPNLAARDPEVAAPAE